MDWGVPLTDEEASQLHARSQLGGLVAEALAESGPEVHSWYGGSWLDQSGDGSVTVYSTDIARTERLFSDALGGTDSHSRVEIEPAEYTLEDVEVILNDLPGNRLSGYEIHSAEFDVRNRQILAYSATTPAKRSVDFRGFDVVVVEADEPTDNACLSRSNCTPLRSGALIRNGSLSGATCTYGFTVSNVNTGNKEFWTAGHCSFDRSDNWYHGGYGYIGAVTYDGDYTGGSKDYARVSIADSRVSGQVYPSRGPVNGWEWPIDNSTVCASLANTNSWDCGTVAATAATWTSSTNGRTMHGARHSGISTIGGDSGAGVVRNAGSYFVAVGVHNTSSGHFTRVNDVVNPWYPGS